MKDALTRAIGHAGGLSALAAKLHPLAQGRNVNYRHVQQWLAVGRAPAEWVLHVERAVDGAVTRYELRPDVFGPAPADKAAA